MSYESIIENKINGNFTIYKEQVKKLNKIQLINLIDIWMNDYGVPSAEVIRQLRLALE